MARDEDADEYAVVTLRPSWIVLSYLALALVPLSRVATRWIPIADPAQRYWRFLLWVPISAGLTGLGLVCGLLALRAAAARPRGAAWLSVVLNGGAFVLCGLASFAIFVIWTR